MVKTLHQMREEKREQDEHQEALRREALAQELAEAEAGQGEMLEEEDGMGDVMLDGARDLDDEIPEGADLSMGFGSSDDDEDEDEEGEDGARDELVTVEMRRGGDAFREALARGHAEPSEMYGGEDDLDEEAQSHMLDEEDFLQADDSAVEGGGEDLDMDADLDDDIPEGELSGYEHTDSDADDVSSSEEEYSGLGAGRGAAALAPPLSPTMRGHGREEPRRSMDRSMDLSSILSRDESSFMESSPAMRGARRQ